MLRKIAKALFASRAWIISIAFLVAVWAIVDSSQPFQDCVKEKYPPGATENFEESISSVLITSKVYRVCLGHFTDHNAEAIIAAFTIILAFSTIFLWVATRDLVRGAEETAKGQLRAYVFVRAKIIHGIADNNILEAHVEIKNYGQTPAYKLTVVSGLAFDTYPPPQSLTLTVPDQDYLSLVGTRMDLGPGDKTFPVTRGRPLTSEEKANLVAGTKAVWVYGEIRYRDTFCRKQWTTYRLIIGGPFGVSGGDLFGCEEGNKAT